MLFCRGEKENYYKSKLQIKSLNNRYLLSYIYDYSGKFDLGQFLFNNEGHLYVFLNKRG